MNYKNERFRPELEALSDQQLDAMLRQELDRDSKDNITILQILHILEVRYAQAQANFPENSADLSSAWEEYMQSSTAPVDYEAKMLRAFKYRGKQTRRWPRAVAAIAAVLCVIMLAATPVMGSENLFALIGRWTKSVFMFLSPDDCDTDPQSSQSFTTDNPGLQQLYDTVCEYGVTRYAVPTWLPDGYELYELKTMAFKNSKKIYAHFINGSKRITLTIEVYQQSGTNRYQKDDVDAEKYECNGMVYHILPNEEKWLVAWSVDNLECMILADCEKESFYQVIQSIYTED